MVSDQRPPGPAPAGGAPAGGQLAGGALAGAASSGVRAVVARLPAAPGVYRFADARGRVLYIGRASSLRSRVASYWLDLRDRAHLAPMVARVASIRAAACASVHEAAWLERNLLAAGLPPWNRTPGGQENEVYIRLDKRPAAPGLSVEYHRRPGDGLLYYGPYLGGLRARQAVAALNRILPLAEAGTRLTGARLEIARARGRAGGDLAGLAAAVAAVLDREPEAVMLARAELEQLRDRAAACLAFELAGRIQEEIQALDWVTCPQRVTADGAGDFTVHGWADGILVSFRSRGGRLGDWSQRSCQQPRAAAALAQTPPEWAEFAQRNAELAAALLGA
jgi:excinuclease ABC subunit C